MPSLSHTGTGAGIRRQRRGTVPVRTV